MAARPSTDASVATSQELLRSALRRSSQRNAYVARRRLWVRWTLWGLGRAARYLSAPALLAGGVALWVHNGGQWPLITPSLASLPAQEHTASAASAQTLREDLAPASLQLRLDAEPPLKRHMPHAQSRKPVAQDKEPAPSTPQETP